MMGWLIPVERAAELRRRTQAKNEKNRLTAGNGGKMKIKELRALTGLSQAKFSQKYGIPKRTIEDWEAGRRVAPAYVEDLLEFRIQHDPDLTGSHNG